MMNKCIEMVLLVRSLNSKFIYEDLLQIYFELNYIKLYNKIYYNKIYLVKGQ